MKYYFKYELPPPLTCMLRIQKKNLPHLHLQYIREWKRARKGAGVNRNGFLRFASFPSLHGFLLISFDSFMCVCVCVCIVRIKNFLARAVYHIYWFIKRTKWKWVPRGFGRCSWQKRWWSYHSNLFGIVKFDIVDAILLSLTSKFQYFQGKWTFPSKWAIFLPSSNMIKHNIQVVNSFHNEFYVVNCKKVCVNRTRCKSFKIKLVHGWKLCHNNIDAYFTASALIQLNEFSNQLQSFQRNAKYNHPKSNGK